MCSCRGTSCWLPRRQLIGADADAGGAGAGRAAWPGGAVVEEPVAKVTGLLPARACIRRRPTWPSGCCPCCGRRRTTGEDVDKIIAEIEARAGHHLCAPAASGGGAGGPAAACCCSPAAPAPARPPPSGASSPCLSAWAWTVLLLAPTGRAAKRMSELTRPGGPDHPPAAWA